MSQIGALSLRAATLADVPLLARLKFMAECETAIAEGLSPDPHSDWLGRALPEILAESGPSSYRNSYVAMMGDALAGMIALNWYKGRPDGEASPQGASVQDELIAMMPGGLLISDIAVFEMFRHKGVASTLLVLAAELATRLGIDMLGLMVQSKNIAALTLYERVGFAPLASRRIVHGPEFAIGQDLVLMTMQVGPGAAMQRSRREKRRRRAIKSAPYG